MDHYPWSVIHLCSPFSGYSFPGHMESQVRNDRREGTMSLNAIKTRYNVRKHLTFHVNWSRGQFAWRYLSLDLCGRAHLLGLSFIVAMMEPLTSGRKGGWKKSPVLDDNVWDHFAIGSHSIILEFQSEPTGRTTPGLVGDIFVTPLWPLKDHHFPWIDFHCRYVLRWIK